MVNTDGHPGPSTKSGGVPTMVDVARTAGVAPMTVSRVFGGKCNVRESTRARVMRAAEALNYVPNQAARRLAAGHQLRLAFLYNNPSSGYLSKCLVGILNVTSRLNTQLMLEHCSGDGLAHVGRLLAGNVDGLILPAPLCDDQRIIELVASSGIPAVAIACGRPDPRIASVSIDDYQAAFDMTTHLIDLGHRRIGFIAGHPDQSCSARRLAGFKAALAERQADGACGLVEQGWFTYRSGLDAAEAFLDREHRPSAIFASNDDMAAAVVATAHRLGLDVPGDLTVVGFDDTEIATTIWPALTTVHQPLGSMAEVAVKLLVRQAYARHQETEPPTPLHEIVAARLVRRQSDAAPRVRPSSRAAGAAPRVRPSSRAAGAALKRA